MGDDWFKELERKVDHFFATATKKEIRAAFKAACAKVKDDKKIKKKRKKR